MQVLKIATKTWIDKIKRALLPDWISALAKSPNRLDRLLVMGNLLKDILVYVYNFFVLKQLLVIGISECLRIKRLIAKTVNKSRRLRVIDPRNQIPEQQAEEEVLVGERLETENSSMESEGEYY